MARPKDNEFGYEGLALAVIQQAVEDYSRACMGLKEGEEYDGEYQILCRQRAINCKKTVYECLVFFKHSTMCDVLIGDSTMFMKKVEDKIKQGLVYDCTTRTWR